jgi:hypothetical protein
MIAKTEKRQLYRQLKLKSPENTGLSGLYRGEGGTIQNLEMVVFFGC